MNNNWKSTWSAIMGAFTSLLTILAALPYELGSVATIITPEWKIRVVVAGAISTFILKVINGLVTADATRVKTVDDTKVDKPGQGILPLIVVFALIPALLLSGCKSIDPVTKDKWAATGKVVGRVAARAAWSLAISSLTSYADKDQKANYLDAAALALRTAQGDKSIVDGDDIKSLLSTWMPNKPHWDELSDATAQIIDKGIKAGFEKDKLLELVAKQFNLTAENVRALIEIQK